MVMTRITALAQGVLVDDLALSQPLCPSGADIVRLEDLKHRGLRQPRILGQIDESQRQCREHEVVGDIEPFLESVALEADIAHTGDREPSNVRREPDD